MENDREKQFITILRAEAESFNRYAVLEQALFTTIKKADPEEINHQMTALREVAGEIESLEDSRRGEWGVLKKQWRLPDEARFYDCLPCFNRSERDEASDAFRDLKLSVLRVQTATAALNDYLRVVGRTVSEVLGELFPHQKGDLYSRKGRRINASAAPFLVNHHQ